MNNTATANNEATENSIPELRITQENNKIKIRILNAPNSVISDMLCGTIETVIANEQCLPETIMLSVKQGMLKSPGKVKIASLSGWKGFTHRASGLFAKVVIVLSLAGCISSAIQGSLLLSILMGALCGCFIFAELN